MSLPTQAHKTAISRPSSLSAKPLDFMNFLSPRNLCVGRALLKLRNRLHPDLDARHLYRRILNSMKLLSAGPYSRLLPTKKMEGGKGIEYRYQLRIGDYRVIYEKNKQRVVICVVRMSHRKDVYRR